MHGRDSLYFLPFKASVVYLMLLFEIMVTLVCPAFSPLLNLFWFVPVVGFYRDPFPYLAPSRTYFLLSCCMIYLRYLLSMFIQGIRFLLFLAPLSIGFYRSGRSKDMRMMVAFFPVDIRIHTHTFKRQALRKGSNKLLTLLKSQLVRQCHFPFSRQSCIALLLNFLNCIPQNFSIMIFLRCILAEKYFRICNL